MSLATDRRPREGAEIAEAARTTSRIASAVYNAFLRTVPLQRFGFTAMLWQRAWNRSLRVFSAPVRTTIHGYPVIVNYGNTYPIYARRYRSLNNPIVELVYQSYRAKQAALSLVDVGAATGDTILLVHANCPDMIDRFYCVDGDREFFGYLRTNLRSFGHGRLIFALLSSETGTERELVRTHPGTASAQGASEVQSTTLDAAMQACAVDAVDVLKIDADGFDGRVLLGAGESLRRYRPAVIFEWHPRLCLSTGNNWTDHFDALGQAGYTRFIWFDKFGNFSHLMRDFDRGSAELLAELCLQSTVYGDWHYDVVALHDSSPITHLALAELRFARQRRSFY